MSPEKRPGGWKERSPSAQKVMDITQGLSDVSGHFTACLQWSGGESRSREALLSLIMVAQGRMVLLTLFFSPLLQMTPCPSILS